MSKKEPNKPPKQKKEKKGESGAPEVAQKAAKPKGPAEPSRLRVRYSKEIVPTLMKHFKYTNIMAVPKLEKIVVNMGLGEAIANAKIMAVVDLSGWGWWAFLPVWVLTTFFGYWLHRLMHYFDVLWRAGHQLHHGVVRVDMRMLGAGVEVERLHLLAPERAARDHPLDRLLEHALRKAAVEHLVGGHFLDAAGVAGVLVVGLLIALVAGEADLLDVDHDDMPSRLLVST